MEQDLPVQFLWGTFCKKAIIDRETQALSVIEVVPSLQSSLQLPNMQESYSGSLPNLFISLGNLTAVAMFEKKTEPTKETKINLRAEMIFPGVDLPIIELPFYLDPNQTHGYAILNLENPYISVNPNEVISNYNCQIIYRINEIEVAKTDLFVNLKITFEEER
jgi:hypothetical protein